MTNQSSGTNPVIYLDLFLCCQQHKCRLFLTAKENLQTAKDWIFASHHFGVTTHYRRESDGSLSIKLEGEMNDVPLFEQVCVLKEVDLHYKWAPFCSSSMTIADLEKIDTVGWFLIGMPHFGLARDGCFRAIGCDNIEEDGNILLVGQGIRDRKPDSPPPVDTFLIDDPVIDFLDIPTVPKRRGVGRMTIQKFEAMIHVTSPTSANTCIVANVDPNLSFLPQGLLDFIMKHLAGVLLAKLQAAAKKIPKNPGTNEHAKRMRQEKAFYKDWLMAKFENMCRQKGWEMPQVTVFDHIDSEPLVTRQGIHRAHTYAGDTTTGILSDSSDSHGPANDSLHSGGAMSSPVLYDDSVSGVSQASPRSLATAMKHNPIAIYMREMQEKIQKRKDEQIAAERRFAAERLRPRALPQDQLERLQQLKLAKARRMGQGAISVNGNRSIALLDSETDNLYRHTEGNDSRWSQRLTDEIYLHKPRTRLTVLFFLVIILFILLSGAPLFLAATDPLILEVSLPSWLQVMLRDVIALLYISICSAVHFLLCDIALVYAFSSLELGNKAGRQIKRYYSEKVRVALAIGSMSVVILSTFKAMSRVAMIAAIWYFTKIWTFLYSTFSLWRLSDINIAAGFVLKLDAYSGGAISLIWKLLDHAIRPLGLAVGLTSSSSVPIIRILLGTFKVCGAFVYRALIHSNLVGKSAESMVHHIFDIAVSRASRFFQNWNAYLQASYDEVEHDPSRISWRDDAFSTAKVLLSYSSIFLLMLIAIFKLSTNRKSAPINVTQGVDTSTITTSDESSIHSLANQFSGLSTLGDDQSYQGNFSLHAPSSTPAFDPIPEESTHSDNGQNALGILHSPSPMRRRRLRFGRQAIAGTPDSSDYLLTSPSNNMRRRSRLKTY